MMIHLGTDPHGNNVELALATAPHMLVAGMTGSGKSVFLNSVIHDLITRYTPREVRLLLIDPKRVELSQFTDSAHMLARPAVRLPESLDTLSWLQHQMDERFTELEKMGLRDLAAIEPASRWPRIVLVIDELANLMLADRGMVEERLADIAAMGRAVGIHLILATQRPSADVITGLIRANVPTRVAFGVVTKTESRIILDEGGAEDITERGDCLVRIPRSRDLLRLHGRYVSSEQIDQAVRDSWRMTSV